ncbi:arylacetamide deacetylase-like 3 [Pteropus medius]|uniref:arylacetamide deacetylase-like 3 n=1 Tax=Pteropus vampyrus TaxID=132908 RepID=UPI00196B7360|nr:arylacetamide deacetylase-like 3 [Pteropus giganteus]
MGILLALVMVACMFFVGTLLWVICINFFTIDIPAAISHPVKLWVFHCISELFLTWGTIFEKLGICTMPQFVRFMHDLKPVKEDPDVVATNLCFGTVPVRLYQPKAASRTPRRGVIFYHGGGGVFGSLKLYQNICSRLSKESDSVVLAVGYRMLPWHKFPVPLRDCITATIHFLKSLNAYEVDPAQVVVCGDSAGGGIAAAICQKLVDSPDLPKIRAQVLIYAILQALDLQLPSWQQNKSVPLLTQSFFFYCMFNYLDISPSWKSAIMNKAHLPAEVWEKYRKWLGSENIPERFKKKGYQPMSPKSLDEDAYLETNIILDLMNSPLIAEDEVVSRVPEAFIVTCEHDILRDHSLLYKKRLEDLGVAVTWQHVEDGFHGALSTLDWGYLEFPCSTRILNAIVHFLKGL